MKIAFVFFKMKLCDNQLLWVVAEKFEIGVDLLISFCVEFDGD